MPRAHIPLWEQKKVFATYLWERGPMDAIYMNQMADQVAREMSKRLKYTK
jgi:hypothetical protein